MADFDFLDNFFDDDQFDEESASRVSSQEWLMKFDSVFHDDRDTSSQSTAVNLPPKKKRIRFRSVHLPYRIVRHDIRRRYCAMFRNVLNMSYDTDFSRRFFHTFCTPDVHLSMFCPSSAEKVFAEGSNMDGVAPTHLHIYNQAAVSRYFTLLQHFLPDCVVTADHVQIVTRPRTREVTVRALMAIGGTIICETPAPVLAHQYLHYEGADNSEGEAQTPTATTTVKKRKADHRASGPPLPTLPWSALGLAMIQMNIVVQLEMQVDEQRRITSIDFSLPTQMAFKQQ